MPRITNETFQLDFPDGWVVESKGPPALLNGPGGAKARVMPQKLVVEGDVDEALAALEEQLLAAVSGTAEQPGMFLEADLDYAGSASQDAGSWFELRAASSDGGRLLWQFGRVQKGGGLLVTVEAPNYAREACEAAREVALHAFCLTERPSEKKGWFGGWFGG